MSRRSSSTAASRADSRNFMMRPANSTSADRAAGRSAATRSGRTAAASIGIPASRATAESWSGGAAPALGDGDGATEGLVVGGIGDELEVAHEISNLPPIVEAHRADDAIRERALAQRLLERTALGIRPVEDRYVAKRDRRRLRATRDELLDDELRLVALVETAGRRDALAAGMRGAECLPHASFVGADDDVG